MNSHDEYGELSRKAEKEGLDFVELLARRHAELHGYKFRPELLPGRRTK